MKCYVLTGDDEWAMRAKRALIAADEGVAARSVERFDLTLDGGDSLVTAASTFNMFGGARLLDAEPADALTAANAADLIARATDVVVVLRGPSAVPAAVKAVLSPVSEMISFRTPTGRAVPARILELARTHNITLTEETRAVLLERGGHDLPRVAGVLSQLANLGMLSPTSAQLGKMLGTSAAPGVPWALSDALESGDLATALAVAGTLDPVAVVTYLASRVGQAGRVLDDGMTDPDAIAGAFGMASRFPAQKIARLAGRIGSAGVAESWNLIAAADRAVKVADEPRAALDILLVNLIELWSAPLGTRRSAVNA